MSRRLVAVPLLLVLVTAGVVCGQESQGTTNPSFGITDNSFLVEEAFNQERGVFQNIGTFLYQHSQWVASFTQEWPMPGETHQFSYTVPFGNLNDGTILGDVLLNYRYQLWDEGPGRPAFSPRVSLSVPSGTRGGALSNDAIGWQINLPFSKQRGDIYLHWNAGFTAVPRAKPDTGGAGRRSLVSPTIAGSVVWQASQTFNLLVEVVDTSSQAFDNGQRVRANQFTISPGFRAALNLDGDTQAVVGIAVPVTVTADQTDPGVLTYFSYETRFRK